MWEVWCIAGAWTHCIRCLDALWFLSEAGEIQYQTLRAWVLSTSVTPEIERWIKSWLRALRGAACARTARNSFVRKGCMQMGQADMPLVRVRLHVLWYWVVFRRQKLEPDWPFWFSRNLGWLQVKGKGNSLQSQEYSVGKQKVVLMECFNHSRVPTIPYRNTKPRGVELLVKGKTEGVLWICTCFSLFWKTSMPCSCHEKGMGRQLA